MCGSLPIVRAGPFRRGRISERPPGPRRALQELHRAEPDRTDPAALGDRVRDKTCAGTWVKGVEDGAPREVYLYHVVDNEWSMRAYGSQAVVRQTAVNPVLALEPLATGVRAGSGVLGAEALGPRPFLDLLTEYGSPWGLREQWGPGAAGEARGPSGRPRDRR
ncbi:hypothetical protein GCM10010282_11910 [Streptomyces roseolus]|nr:hypothetical protein GCM10010282_11910 [Streptomyces roseolus]